MIFWISLGVLFFCLLVQALNFFLFKKNLGKFSRVLFVIVIVIVIVYYAYLTYAQYSVWKNSDGVAKYLVPPYKSIAYVLGYHFIRFALYYAISLFIALLFLWAAKHYNKKFGGRFFEPEEPYLGALAIFLLGNGGWNYAWIQYLAGVLIFSVLGSLIYTYLLKKNGRFPLYWLWIPTAIVVIIVSKFVVSSL